MKVVSGTQKLKGYDKYEKFVNVLYENGKIDRKNRDELLERAAIVLKENYLKQGKEYLTEIGKKLKADSLKKKKKTDEGKKVGLIEEGEEGEQENINESFEDLRAKFKAAIAKRNQRLSDNLNEDYNATITEANEEEAEESNMLDEARKAKIRQMKAKGGNLNLKYTKLREANDLTDEELEMIDEARKAKIRQMKARAANTNLKLKKGLKEATYHDPIMGDYDDPDFVPAGPLNKEKFEKEMSHSDWPGSAPSRNKRIGHDAMLGNFETDEDELETIDHEKLAQDMSYSDWPGTHASEEDLANVSNEIAELVDAEDKEGIAEILSHFSLATPEEAAETREILAPLSHEDLSWIFTHMSSPGCSDECFRAAELAQKEIWKRIEEKPFDEGEHMMTESRQPLNESFGDSDEREAYIALKKIKASGRPWLLGDTTERVYRELRSKFGETLEEAKKKNVLNRTNKKKGPLGSASGEGSYNVSGKERMEYDDKELVEASEFMSRKYPARLSQKKTPSIDVMPSKGENLSSERLGNYLKAKAERKKKIQERLNQINEAKINNSVKKK
jgi:hypothetical protein